MPFEEEERPGNIQFKFSSAYSLKFISSFILFEFYLTETRPTASLAASLPPHRPLVVHTTDLSKLSILGALDYVPFFFLLVHEKTETYINNHLRYECILRQGRLPTQSENLR